jgi:hypothetical protein
MRIRHVLVLCVVALASLGLVGCGSSGQSASSSKQEITTRWVAFWGGKGSAADLQDSSQLQATYTKLQTSPLAKGAGATVHTVTLLSSGDCKTNGVPSPCAKVTYDILANGQVVLPNSTGFAVKQSGKWLVSKATFCTLATLGNNNTPPQGC